MDAKKAFSLIYPIQPFFVGNASVRYLKNTMSDSPIAHFYMYRTSEEAVRSSVIPDGSIDIVFVCDEDKPYAYLCGPVTEFSEIAIKPGITRFGVRCHPGVLPGFLDVAWREVLNNKYLLSDISDKHRDLTEMIAGAKSFRERMDLFTRACMTDAEKWASPKSEIFGAALAMIFQRKGLLNIDELSENLHYSIRYIDKVFRNDAGMTPKQYCRTIRFQSLLKKVMAAEGGKKAKLTELAMEMGYYDHSHMLREFRFFTTMSPSEYLKNINAAAYFSKVRDFARAESVTVLNEIPFA